MAERVTYTDLPVGGAELLIAGAVRYGDLLFLSGRAPIDVQTLELVSDDFETQARSVLDQIVEALREAGSGPEHVLRVVCYLTDAGNFAAWNRLWAEYFPAPRPARTTVVAGFVIAGMLIEVEVTAAAASRS
jgi:2-iminobutanoate/2-iminopropanoate deaminase